MTQEEADAFAARWIEAWKAHDLDAILDHWADDLEFTSPVAARLLGDASATVRGREALRGYWERRLAVSPDLHFELDAVHVGYGSVVIAYRNERGTRCAEMIAFGPYGLAVRGAGHYHPAL